MRVESWFISRFKSWRRRKSFSTILSTLLLLSVVCTTLSAFSQGPPPPPGMGTTTTKLLSPKAAEQSASLATPMVSSATSTTKAFVVPPGLVITNISVNEESVKLSWQMSPGSTVQVQQSADFAAWIDTGAPVSGNFATVPKPQPPTFFRLKLLPPATPGECQLQRTFGGTNSNGSATTKAVVRDHAGNVIICGLMYYSVNLGAGVLTTAGYTGQDAFIAKYSPDGTCLWSKRFGNVSNDSASGVAVDSADNIILIGSFSGSPFPSTLDFGLGPMSCRGGSDIFVAKFSPNGTPLWSKLYGGTGADTGIAVAVDVVDYIFITGTHGFFGSGADFGGGVLPTYGQQDVFLAKLDSNGGHVWSKSFGGGDSDSVTAIAVDMVNPIICGNFRGTANFGSAVITSAGDTDAFLGHYSGVDGSLQWFKRFGDSRGQSATGVSVDGNGAVTFCGDFLGSIDFGGGNVAAQTGGSFYVASYDASGAFRWSRDFGAPDNGPHAAAVCSSTRGPCVVGEMITGIDFGTGWLLGQGGNDAMIVQFDDSGNVSWAKRGAPFGNRATACAGGNSLTVSGDNGNQPVDFGCGNVLSTLGTVTNGFWVRFGP